MSEPATLEALTGSRRERDRPTNVHVVDDVDRYPPKGLATAHRVAALLVDEEGTDREGKFDDLDDGDVAFVEPTSLRP